MQKTATSPIPAVVPPAPAAVALGTGVSADNSGTVVTGAASIEAATAAPATPRNAGPAVRYTVSFPNAVHHEAHVVATFTGVPAEPLRVRMARSSPGRYAIHDFIKNVYYVTATDATNHLLAINKPDPYSWDITPPADGKVVFNYTVYGDRTDGTYLGIDQQHAHLNTPALLCYALGLEGRAAEVKFEPVAGWRIATQLQPGADKTTFTAPNLDYLMDSPVSLGPIQEKSWTEGGQTISMAVQYQGTPLVLDAYVKQAQKVVREEMGVFGELPSFDFGRYTFLANYLSQATGDGMEHRNSSSLTSNGPLAGEESLDNLATLSHEFFHSWNVERIRPKDLEPFDYQRVNMSDALWFAEGFTQYYGELVLRRMKAYDDEQFFAKISNWVNLRQNSPGAKYASAVDMSRQAAFTDAAASIDPTNRVNTTLSYYAQGAGLALALDLQLREKHRSSLDKYMQALWKEFGKNQTNYAPATPYTLRDLQRVLGEVSHDTAYAARFFRQHVMGRDQPRFSEVLLPAGLVIVPSHALGAALPRQVEFDDEGRCLVAVNTTIGSGLYKAGIDRGDQIVMLDGKEIKAQQELTAVMRKHSPNELVSAKIKTRGGVEKLVQLVLTEDPNVQVQPVEAVDKMHLETKQKELRDAWLGSQAGQ